MSWLRHSADMLVVSKWNKLSGFVAKFIFSPTYAGEIYRGGIHALNNVVRMLVRRAKD